MKIRTKNFLFTSGIIILVVTIAFSTLYLLMPKYYQHKKQNEIKKAVASLITKIEDQPESEKTAKLLSQESFYSGLIFVLKNKSGKVVYPKTADIYGGFIFSEGERPPEAKDGNQDNLVKESSVILNLPLSLYDNFKYLTYSGNFKEGYVLTVLYPLQPINEAQQVLLDIYPFVLGLCFVIGALATYLYSHFSTKRIKNISAVTRKMTNSTELIINEVKGKDEVSQLSQDIQFLHSSLVQTNEKLSQDLAIISNLENVKAEFMQIASHELKTPVTALSGIIEGMIYRVGPYQDRDKYLQVCQEIITAQTKLIKDILYISKIDQVQEQIVEDFLLDDLIREELPMFDSFVFEKDYQLSLFMQPLEITANKEEVRRVIKNLLSNAMNHTTLGGKITLKILKKQFVLENECQPLQANELAQIYEAFYRPDFARDRKDGGTGLGLFIVSQLLDKNHFDYEFTSMDVPKGMVFKIKFNE